MDAFHSANMSGAWQFWYREKRVDIRLG